MMADLVVGADGLHSCLRPVLNRPAAPRFTGQVAWRALVPRQSHGLAQVQLYMGPGRHLVTYPLRGGQLVNVVAVQE
ncbi:MAG: monooxygenase, partial [Paracoccaceae bacterium]